MDRSASRDCHSLIKSLLILRLTHWFLLRRGNNRKKKMIAMILELGNGLIDCSSTKLDLYSC